MGETAQQRRERLKALAQRKKQLEAGQQQRRKEEEEVDEEDTPDVADNGVEEEGPAVGEKRKQVDIELEGENEDNDGAEESNSKKGLRFRNYQVHTKALKEVAEEVAPAETVDLKTRMEEELQRVKNEASTEADDILNLAPKKPHIDLHRAIEKKLKKLDRRTQKALTALAQMEAEDEEAE
uniref:Uncharacterized protein n=1 Tax=Palpitomonas bilix TaxID=652834 RepID=A0A7S3D013_9EUKA|mmetsp:Transcript_16479/g.41717  ORF Transcript_16479/g.41717 Transcript_16479/m.41717 type:complete len:181 (+) Transcript_16479:240-782(+)